MPNEPVKPATPAPAAAAPATPPTPATAPGVVYASDEMMIRGKVDGKEVVAPVKDVREALQLRSAAEKRFAEAQAIRDRNQAAVALYERLDKSADPEALLDSMQAELEARHGRPIKRKNTTPDTDVSDDVNPATRDSDRRFNALKAEVDELRANTTQGRVQSEVSRVLDAYPQYQQGHESFDPDAREEAEMVLLATKKSFPTRPLDEIGASINTRYVNTIERVLNRTRDRRAAAEADHAGVPPSQTSASMTPRERFTLADIKSGKAHGAIQQLISQGKGMLNLRK